MQQTHDVFSSVNGQPYWIGAAGTLSAALQLIQKSSESASCGSYIVYCPATGERLHFSIDENGRIVRLAEQAKS